MFFRIAQVLDVVIGEETAPPRGSPEYNEWDAKDMFASTIILNSVDHSKISIPSYGMSASEMWRKLRHMYQQIGSVSIVLWMRKLVQVAEASTSSSLRAHIRKFESALAHLAYAGVEFPEHTQSYFLLSTLPGDHSWTRFISNMRINESTTLTSTISAILGEIHIREIANSIQANRRAIPNTQTRRARQ